MTETEQRVAIAEACGLNTVKEQVGGIFCFRDKAGRMVGALPDYLHDLNACAEMRKSLAVNEQLGFIYELSELVAPITGDEWCLVDADAPDQCKAFLKVKGLWK